MPRKQLVGIVVSDKASKTRRVEIERLVPHLLYGKYIRRHTVCHVHDEDNASRAGDTVEIIECPPKSRTKRWNLVRIIARAERVSLKRHEKHTPEIVQSTSVIQQQDSFQSPKSTQSAASLKSSHHDSHQAIAPASESLLKPEVIIKKESIGQLFPCDVFSIEVDGIVSGELTFWQRQYLFAAQWLCNARWQDSPECLREIAKKLGVGLAGDIVLRLQNLPANRAAANYIAQSLGTAVADNDRELEIRFPVEHASAASAILQEENDSLRESVGASLESEALDVHLDWKIAGDSNAELSANIPNNSSATAKIRILCETYLPIGGNLVVDALASRVEASHKPLSRFESQ